MTRFKLIVLLIILCILTGCGMLPSNNSASPERTTQIFADDGRGDGSEKLPEKNTDDDAGSANDSPGNKDDGQPVSGKPVEAQPTNTPLPTDKPVKPDTTGNLKQPESGVGEKLDFRTLDSLDNTKYSWWISLNKKHDTPGIPSIAQKLISMYSGIYVGDTSKKVVYLTFDEGYENGYTPKILDTLKEDDVKSIFFVTGPYIKNDADLIRRMLAEGHQVGNHTINHLSLPGVNDSKLENELYGNEKQFTALFGIGFKYFRPPNGEYSARVLDAAQQLGYKTVFWSFAYKDYDTNDQKGEDYAYKMVMDNVHNGAVILLHAVSKDNANALDRIIKSIREDGYTINPFDL